MKIGFIGCGNMGGAIATAVSKSEGVELYLADYSREKSLALSKKINATPFTNKEIAAECNFVFLGVKPGVIRSVLEEIKSEISSNENAVIVTMAAGVPLSALEEMLPQTKIIRIMPNTPVAVGHGMITWCKGALVTDCDAKMFSAIMSNAGRLDLVSEIQIDAATAVAGCGPAFVYMFAEALADGGVKCGLARDKAMDYAIQTLIGAAEMIRKTGKHPGQLKDEVCSPGGSTIEGVHALEDGAFRSLAANAVIAAYEKTKKLAK